MIETINKLNRISRKLLQEKGREGTPEELAIEMEMPEDKVRKVMKIAKEPISMETPIGDDEDSSLGDFIEDGNVQSPIESATATGLGDSTREVLGSLTPREAKVLRMRFGIEGPPLLLKGCDTSIKVYITLLVLTIFDWSIYKLISHLLS